MYTLLGDSIDDGVMVTETKSVIPNDLGNRDWREFIEWLDAGNIPKPKRPSINHTVWTGTQWVPTPEFLETWIDTYVRRARNIELNETDWTQLPDAPLTPEEVLQWREYRQELRDITELDLSEWAGLPVYRIELLEILGREDAPDA